MVKVEDRDLSLFPPQSTVEFPCSKSEKITTPGMNTCTKGYNKKNIEIQRGNRKEGEELTNSTTKVPIRPIIQALEFQISAVLVKPRKGALNFGSVFGTST